MTISERTVNGQPGLIAQLGGATGAVYAFEVAGDRVTRMWAILNPGKTPALDDMPTRVSRAIGTRCQRVPIAATSP